MFKATLSGCQITLDAKTLVRIGRPASHRRRQSRPAAPSSMGSSVNVESGRPVEFTGGDGR